MKVGDLVKCIDTGSLGIVTRVSVRDPGTSAYAQYDYKVLWPWRSLTWETSTTVRPIPDKEYAE